MLDFYNPNDQPSIYEKQERVKQVKSSIVSFSAEKDQEKQMKFYLNMLSVIEGFIVEEQSEESKYFVVERLLGNKIYDFIPKITKSIIHVIQTLRILPQLEKISKKSPPPIVLCLFGPSCKFSSQQKQLILLSKNYFSKVLSSKDFPFQFENNYLLENLWPALTPPLPEEIQNYIMQIIKLFKSKSASYDEKTFTKFTNLVDKQLISAENAYFASKFICVLFQQYSTTIPEIRTSFINCQVPKSLESLFKFLNKAQKSEILKILLDKSFIFFTG